MANSMGTSLTLSENLSTTLKQQEAQIAELQKREAVDNLVAGMSHNLNNYLQPILLLSQHMNKPDKDAETQQMLSVITESAMNARNVLDKVLAFSRADAREQPASTDSLTTVMNLVTSSARASETIETDIQTHPTPFALAASDLNTIVLNLVNNSLDSRDALTRITLWITGKVIENGYQLTLRDNGSGMDKATLKKAMNKFFTTKPVGKGTGLGLSEARELMEAAGGQLEITSTLGEGTTVSLHIPFRQHAEPTDG
jgi:signal transduction histidine kinase